MRYSKRWGACLTLLFGLLFSACNGGGGVGPSPIPNPNPNPNPIPNPTTTFTITSGRDYSPVPGAQVNLNGDPALTATTDGSGQATIAGTFSASSDVVVTKDGFAQLHAHVKDGTSFALWPADSSLPTELTHSLVFSGDNPPIHNLTDTYLHRIDSDISLVVDDPTIQSDPAAMQTIRDSASTCTAAIAWANVPGKNFTCNVVSAVIPGTIGVTIVIDPTIGARLRANASTRVVSINGRIGSASMSFIDLSTVETKGVVLHELGRVFGMLGFNTQSGVMSAFDARNYTDYTPAEKLSMRMMLLRPPQTEFPDTWP